MHEKKKLIQTICDTIAVQQLKYAVCRDGVGNNVRNHYNADLIIMVAVVIGVPDSIASIILCYRTENSRQ